ncbi:MAG: FG-GAP repeat protein, partial [Polyangiales bacterium]
MTPRGWIARARLLPLVLAAACGGQANKVDDPDASAPGSDASTSTAITTSAVRVAQLPQARAASAPSLFRPEVGPDGALTTRDLGGRVEARFSASGLALTRVGVELGTNEASTGRLFVARVGRVGAMRSIDVVEPGEANARVTFEHAAGWSEWYEHGPAGLEQGFDIATRAPGDGALSIEVKASGWTPSLSASGNVVLLRDAAGRLVFDYGKLAARDADGHALDATMLVEDGAIVLRVRDQGARYPITIDPLVWTQLPDLTALDGAANDQFGNAIAVSGTTAIIGAQTKTKTLTNQGAAYVFTQSGNNWTQQQELVSPTPVAGAYFGSGVAISGTTMVIGAVLESNHGAAYVFTPSGSSWVYAATLTDPAPTSGEYFGTVATNGSTILVGAPFKTVGGSAYEGAVLSYSWSGSAWTPHGYFTGSDSVGADWFGASVAMSGSLAIVGAKDKNESGAGGVGAAYIFSLSGTTWTQQG